jgi:ubiquinone/menaquinone biosynthesis C-methylase UbiE
LKAYPAQRGVAEKLRALGCQEVQLKNLLGGAMCIHYARKG